MINKNQGRNSYIIGGMFGLADPVDIRGTDPPFASYGAEALYLSSGLAWIYHLVETLRPDNIWMPSYLCRAMVDCIAHRRDSIRFYPVDRDLNLSDLAWQEQLNKGDRVCVVDYFRHHSPVDVKKTAREAGGGCWGDTSLYFCAYDGS
jgi:hypothetical protein